MKISSTIRTYYYLTKPGIVYGNAIAAIAGYFYGAGGSPILVTFTAMLTGICFVMASACVYNNVLDRSIDARMKRTERRAVVTKAISVTHALIFATVLLAIGIFLLAVWTNTLTLLVALAGHFAYVVLYGWAKRHTVHSTLIGTISGSTPPVIGYVAATGALDITALLLFAIMAAWQMPHFYAIAIFRRDEYAAANLPILSVVKGIDVTRRQIIAYATLFVVLCGLLFLYGGASLLWFLVMALAGGYWLLLVLQPYNDINKWARKQFGWSLSVLLIMCVGLSLDSFWH